MVRCFLEGFCFLRWRLGKRYGLIIVFNGVKAKCLKKAVRSARMIGWYIVGVRGCGACESVMGYCV